MTPFGIFNEHFDTMPDPRKTRPCDHPLENVIFIALCAVLAGADDWVAVAEFAEENLSFFEQNLDLTRGVPSHDTFGRVFAALDPERFHHCFAAWTRALVARLAPGQVVAIDGKTARRSADEVRGAPPIHLVSAFAAADGLTLGQVRVDAKANEIVAIPKLLECLSVEGCVVTLDAMGCQKSIAAAIRRAGADYVLRLKDNHPRVREEVEALFIEAREPNSSTPLARWLEVDGGHGRVEQREVLCTERLGWFEDRAQWHGLRSLVCVISTREVGDEVSAEERYYLSSLPGACEADAQRQGSSIRAHWGIENRAHWILDVVFGEDQNRSRRGDGAQNLALLRKLALNLLRRDDSIKGSLRIKRRKVGWSPEKYLPGLLTLATQL